MTVTENLRQALPAEKPGVTVPVDMLQREQWVASLIGGACAILRAAGEQPSVGEEELLEVSMQRKGTFRVCTWRDHSLASLKSGFLNEQQLVAVWIQYELSVAVIGLHLGHGQTSYERLSQLANLSI